MGGPPAGGSVPSRNHLAHITLWLDYTPWGAHVPIYVAQRKGYFARHGLDVSIRSPGNVTDPLKLVAAQPNTLGIGYMSDVVTAESRGIPVESIAAIVQHHLNCIMTLKSSGITSPRQLAGKSIGAAETPADNVILDTVFRRAGVEGKVSRVNVNYNYVPALISGRVAAIEGAYQVWERIQMLQRGYRTNVIQLQRWGVPDEYELVLLAGHQLIHSHPKTLHAFMAALSQGVKFSTKNARKAAEIFVSANRRYDNVEGRKLVRESWRRLVPFVAPAGVRFGSQSGARWHGLEAWMYRTHLIAKRVPDPHLFTNRFDP